MIVAPFVGAWIETNISKYRSYSHTVAPFVGAWIETNGTPVSRNEAESLLS